ncbi:MAG: hypothetical protein KFB97_12605 [Cyanobium sp. M30B3]|nr:MAG: hypothetical protein KFB97_12605 [Cyanobium sp. M30B3]
MPARAPGANLLLTFILIVLAGCSGQGSRWAEGACRDGTANCAAAEAPAGMRQVRRGHRMVSTEWVERTNRESGGLDIGLKARWAPVIERR